MLRPLPSRPTPAEPDSPEAPRSTRARGQAGEALACAHLVAQGYRIVDCNFAAPGGEIDIVAREGDVLCFVEVRCRATLAAGHPLETLDAAKWSRIARAAAAYLAQHGPAGACRFDAIGIVLGAPPAAPDITLVREAFVPTRVY